MATPVDRSEGFTYEETFDDSSKDQLFHGILAGLYYLPPEYILKHQSGWGWPIHYEEVSETKLDWKSIENTTLERQELIDVLPRFESICYAEIKRRIDNKQCGLFRIYKLKLTDEVQADWKDDLENIAIKGSEDNTKNIAVSNAGGYHSKPTFFADHSNEDVVEDISGTFYSALELVERHDYCKSKSVEYNFQQKEDSIFDSRESRQSADDISKSCRHFQQPSETEAWLNLSRHGAWNRLHTHEGAAWSGVYYVKVPETKHQMPGRNYSGCFVMKPSPHSTECGYSLKQVELDRLNITTISDDENKDLFLENNTNTEKHGVKSKCNRIFDKRTEYVSLPPEEGTIILFPSYVHHAVVPLAVQEEVRGTFAEARISLAFNFNEEEPMSSNIK